MDSRIEVYEDDAGMVEVCVEVKTPDIECPVVYPIEFIVKTTEGTAGIDLQHLNMTLLVEDTLHSLPFS